MAPVIEKVNRNPTDRIAAYPVETPTGGRTEAG